MKSLILILSLALASTSFADYRAFDCTVKKIHSELLPVHEDLNLGLNPDVLFVERPSSWALAMGDLVLNPNEEDGPALKMESRLVNSDLVEYLFWVDGSLEYELGLQVSTDQADLYWWGTGEKEKIADLQCFLVE